MILKASSVQILYQSLTCNSCFLMLCLWKPSMLLCTVPSYLRKLYLQVYGSHLSYSSSTLVNAQVVLNTYRIQIVLGSNSFSDALCLWKSSMFVSAVLSYLIKLYSQVQVLRFRWKWRVDTQWIAILLWGAAAPYGMHGPGTCAIWGYLVSNSWHDCTRGEKLGSFQYSGILFFLC